MSSPRSAEDIYAVTLAVFEQTSHPNEPLTSSEVAEALDCPRRTVYKRLEKLVDQGELKTKKIGASARVWWRPPTDSTADAPVASRSESTEQERLEGSEWRYRTLADHFPNGAVALFDHDLRYTLVSGSAVDEADLSPEDIEGRRVGETVAAGSDLLKEHCRAALAGEKRTFEFDWRDRVYQTWMLPVRDETGAVSGGMVMTQDITDRVEREHELERYETIVETMVDGVFVTDPDRRYEMVNDAYVEMTGYSREELLGADTSMMLSEAGVEAGGAMSEEILSSERESGVWELSQHTADGQIVPVESRFVLLPTDGEYRGSIGVVRDITERKERESQLARQRQELASLNDLHTAIRNVTEQVLAQSTQDEIERRLCTELVESGIYDFAWIGRVPRNGTKITVQTAAGMDEQLADITVSLDEDSPTGRGPIARAVKTRSVQISQNVFEDPAYAQWTTNRVSRDHSVLVVPITYKGRLYGVLNLFTERSVAESGLEEELVQQLGKVIGHAITSLEREKSLLADRAIEVVYRSKALAAPFVASADGDVRLWLDRAIPLADGEFLQYYTIDGLTGEQAYELVDDFSAVTEIHVLFDEGDYIRVGMRTTGDTISALFTTFSGRTKSIEITEGQYRIVGELPETANIREVTEAVTELYPDIEFAGQQHITRKPRTPREFWTMIEDSFSDQQRAALESAFYSGFFNWPRESSGEDVADALGVSSSTFHQHLRKAEKKLLDVVWQR